MTHHADRQPFRISALALLWRWRQLRAASARGASAGALSLAVMAASCGAPQQPAPPPLPTPLPGPEPEVLLCSALEGGGQRALAHLADTTARVMLASTSHRPFVAQEDAALAIGGEAAALWSQGTEVPQCDDDIGYRLVATLRSASPRRWRDAAEHFDQLAAVQTLAAREAWRQDDLASAIGYSRAATLLAPADCAALLMHARLLRDGLYRAQEALAALDACDDAPMVAVVQHERGLTLEALSRATLAAEAHRAAADADEHYFAPRAALGRIAYEQGDLFTAITALREAEAIDPGAPDVLVNLAVALEESSQDFAQAADLYERAMASDPTYVGAYLNFGTLLIDALGQLERGAELLHEALRLDPTLEPARAAIEALAARPHLGVDALAGIWEAAYVAEDGQAIRVLLTLNEDGGMRWVEQGTDAPRVTEWSWLLGDVRGPQLFFEVSSDGESRERVLEWRTDAEFDWYSMDEPVSSRLRFRRIGTSDTEARARPTSDEAPAPSTRT